MSDPRALNNNQAAVYIGLAPYTLKHSRSSGLLCGHLAPSYKKLGVRKVVYEKSTLDAWLNQFENRANTAS